MLIVEDARLAWTTGFPRSHSQTNMTLGTSLSSFILSSPLVCKIWKHNILFIIFIPVFLFPNAGALPRKSCLHVLF